MGQPFHSAVLMGDLVRSETQPQTERLHRSFNAAVDRLNRRRADLLASPLTITLGDEFQGIATSLAAAAGMVRVLRLDLLEADIDCRFAIGVVTLRTRLNPERAWNMMGPGLAQTRARLNEKRDDTLYRFTLPDQPILETMLEASGATLTSIERGWTATQRRDITALLDGATPAQIAERRNVTVHSVYKVRGSGAFDLYHLQWAAIEQTLGALDSAYGLTGRRP